jgi:hypothetical protein
VVNIHHERIYWLGINLTTITRFEFILCLEWWKRVNVLQDIKGVSLEKIANALPLLILFESRRKKIQRFLSLPILNIQKIWLPIIENWLSQNF